MAGLDDIVTSLLGAVMRSFRADVDGAVGVGVLVWGDDGELDETLSVVTDDGPAAVRALAGVDTAPHLLARRERRLVRCAPDGEVRTALDRAGLTEVRGVLALPTEWGRDGDCVLLALLDREPTDDDTAVLARWEPLVVSSTVTAVTCRGAAEQVGELVEVLRARVVIEQAKGMVMARHKMPADEAFELLRTVSQHSNTPVRALARAVVLAGAGRDSSASVAGVRGLDGVAGAERVEELPVGPRRLAQGLLDPGLELR